ncbi:MAG: hypothetical protein J6Q50_06640 [Clostridia bacterium]|nr:hypothetical protein [Clostridia bacterium]
MAKKPLTPEQAEIKAMKKAKSSENWTKFWAILLAAVLTVAVVFMGKTAAEDAIAKATGAQTEEGGDVNTPSGDTNTPSGDTNTPSGDTNTPSGDTNTPSGDTNTPNTPNTPAGNTGVTAADAAKAINDATAKAAKASYKWTRSGKFTENVNVGALTGALNTIISGVVKNNDYPGDDHYTVNEVVGGFLGIKDQSATFTNGKTEDLNEKDSNKYMLKAMKLTADDIADVSVSGNTYTIKIKDTNTPDANSAWAHASNDYITVDEVNAEIASAVGDQVKVQKDGTSANYTNIKMVAVIENGNLTSLKYSYDMKATLVIKVLITATGTGAGHMEATYSDFKY